MATKGEYRVGASFNPTNNSLVDQIKALAADLIDLIDGIPDADNNAPLTGEFTRQPEVRRLKALAQTSIEEGAMWAVKAATKPAP